MSTLLRRGFALCHFTQKGLLEETQKGSVDEMLEKLEGHAQSTRCRRGFILEGVPDNAIQARKLETRLQSVGLPLDHVFYLNADELTCQKRADTRLIHEPSGRRYNSESLPPRSSELTDEVTRQPLAVSKQDRPEAFRVTWESVASRLQMLRLFFGQDRSQDALDASEARRAATFVNVDANRGPGEVYDALKAVMMTPRAETPKAPPPAARAQPVVGEAAPAPPAVPADAPPMESGQ
eukprot:CAMPEP_0204481350 /NCGR_PEP_ID=MMETSP0471-20130131/46953_1 /ASSEMBLY_ACC=CAM_ASM_000602 /TAXON_ID=2969 /ORGANISM="Oxyrrhis marina" /LENGTH=236 /DNA_ID=CAMNT_0051484499 /DNA_START=180 /DNA_END=890 /DNA_ORIENTATION=-